MPTAAQPKVALLIETSNAYARGILRGVEDYIRARGPWSVYLAEHGRGDRPPSWLANWKGDGIIARIENRTIARALGRMKVPIVDVSAARLLPGVPWVETDDTAIAEAAAQHFFERGFQHFAFCGDARFNWSQWREARFAEFVRARGYASTSFATRARDVADDAAMDALARWIERLPKPVAIFACYDARGQQVLDACRRAGVSVPEQVAVLGVDNDEILCDLSPPPLSSIIPNARKAGWVAAELVAGMMAGARTIEQAHLIPPIGIATRQSTDIAAVADPHVAMAAGYIRENACRGIGVQDVVRIVPLARRLLEKRFRAALGRTLREEITRVQIHRVKRLLTETELPLAEIAGRTGFRHVEYLTVVFKRETGQPPSVFRSEQRPGRTGR